MLWDDYYTMLTPLLLVTKQSAAPLVSLLNSVVSRLRESEKEEAALQSRATELLSVINSAATAASPK